MKKRGFFQKAPHPDQAGFALIMVMSSVLVLEIICLFLNQARGTQAVISSHRAEKLKSVYLAKAGVAHGLWRIQEDPNWRTQMNNLSLGDGAYTVSFTEDPNRPRIGISSQSQVGGIKSSAARTVHYLTIQPEQSADYWEADTYLQEGDIILVNDEKKELKLDTESGGGTKRCRTLAKYNLKKYSLPNKASVIAARFSMYLYDPDEESDFVTDGIINDVYRIHRVTNSWEPHETCWKYRNKNLNQQWSAPAGGGDFDPNSEDSLTFSCMGWKTWSITYMTRYWMKYPGQNHGFIIEANARTGNNECRFRSSNNDLGQSFCPKLDIYYLDARSP